MTPKTEPPCVTWRKSSRSTNGGNCVEVAHTGNHYLVRDSKNPNGPQFVFSASNWATFLGRIKVGDFDPHP